MLPEPARKRFRKILTGSENKKLRDHIRENTNRFRSETRKRLKEVEETLKLRPVIKLIDRFVFFIGVITLLLTEAVLLIMPHYFGSWYVFIITPVLALRFKVYQKKKWGYFCIDFCYFVCISCLANIILAPNNFTWIRLNYILSTGPLAIASVTWRNSLVFHSMDKVTSTLIHVFPPILMYNVRWFPSGIDEDYEAKINKYLNMNVSTMLGTTQLSRMCDNNKKIIEVGKIDKSSYYFYHYETLPPCSFGMDYFELFYNGLLFYAFWQLAYLAITEVFHAGFLNREASYQTSLRWLAVDTRNSMNRITHKMCVLFGVLKRGEKFDPDTIKTKCIFVATQLIFTTFCLVPVKFLYDNWILNFIFLAWVFCVILWNGASYYFNVFTVRYEKELPGIVDLNSIETIDPDADPNVVETTSSKLNVGGGNDNDRIKTIDTKYKKKGEKNRVRAKSKKYRK
jgi:hypothetical protein